LQPGMEIPLYGAKLFALNNSLLSYTVHTRLAPSGHTGKVICSKYD